MSYESKIQSTMIITSPLALESEGDRLFAAHKKWIETTHPREGEEAILHYSVSKSSGHDNHIMYSIVAIFETAAGIQAHRARTDFELQDDFQSWLGKCEFAMMPQAVVINSL